jgi:CheY-like chemotaxis protein
MSAGAGRGRVLIVDDEVLITSALRRILAGAHDVVVANLPEQALRLIVDGERFDVILCDLMMPAMTGMDLHAQLATAAPAQARRMVFLTGGAFTPSARAFLESVPNRRLEKPFDPKVVSDLVAEMVAAGADANDAS